MQQEPTREELEKRLESLEREMEQYRDFINTLPQVVFEADLDGRIVFTNEFAFSVFGYTRADYERGITVIQILVPEDRGRARDNMERILRGESLESREYNALRKDGSAMPIMIHSTRVLKNERPVGLRGSITDITELKRTEKALRASEERYRILFEQARDVIYFTTPEGRLIDMNQAGLDLLEYTREEFKQIDVTDHHTDPAQRDKEKEELHVRGVIKDKEIVLRKKDGTEIICLDSATVWRDPEGEVIGYIGTLRDITEKKRAEREKAKLERQLRQAHKMEAVGTLAGGIAHDFNNLLMGIQGNASLALLDLAPEHPHYERMKNIGEYVRSGAYLTKQLLGFARGGKYEVKPTDLNALVAKTSEMFGRTRKEIRIHAAYQEGLWPVEVDQGQIDQVLVNLYVNAWQSMPRGGDLYLKTENVILNEKDAAVHALPQGRYVMISVEDTGIGMDEATQQRIFDPFFTTKARGRGTGLGLASAYGIVKNHGGMIQVHSRKGKGSVFRIHLRASEGRVRKEEASGTERVYTGCGTVLLVDDEEMILDVGKQILEHLGYRVLTARCGREAVEIYREKGDTIDLVVLDMIMPDMSGEETYERLRKIRSEVKVLLSSGYSLESHAMELLERGCGGFIQKPFDMEEFSWKMRGLIDG